MWPRLQRAPERPRQALAEDRQRRSSGKCDRREGTGSFWILFIPAAGERGADIKLHFKAGEGLEEEWEVTHDEDRQTRERRGTGEGNSLFQDQRITSPDLTRLQEDVSLSFLQVREPG